MTPKEKESKLNIKHIYLFLVIIFFIFLIWWLFYSKFFTIKYIEIEGTINDSIKEDINKFYDKNILLFTIGKMDTELAKKQTSIEKLNIIKGIPNTLKIKVGARSPEIRWKTKDKIYFIDKNGIIFELNEDLQKFDELPLVIDNNNLEPVLGKKIVTNDFVEFVKKAKQKILDITKKEINEIIINETTIHLEFKLKDSFRILLNTMDNIDNQFKLLEKIISDKINEVNEYIDLRVENKAYYK